MSEVHERADAVAHRTRLICAPLDVDKATEDRAVSEARASVLERPINRQPGTVAAASVYFAGLMENDKVSQAAVGNVADVSENAIRACYHEIAECNDIQLQTDRSASSSDDHIKTTVADTSEESTTLGLPSWVVSISTGVVTLGLAVSVFTSDDMRETVVHAEKFGAPLDPVTIGVTLLVAVLAALMLGLVDFATRDHAAEMGGGR